MTAAQITIRKVDLRVGELVRNANRIMGSNFLVIVGLSTLALLANSFLPVVLEGALMVGLMICFQRVQAGKPIGVETLFEGFEFFVESFIARLVLLVVQLLCSLMLVPSYALLVYGATQDHEGIVALAALSLGIAAIPFTLFMLLHSVLAFALIAQHKAKGVDAVKIAARGILANPLASAKLGASALGIMMLGVLLCGVGILITTPFAYIMIWLAAKELFETDATEEENITLPA